MKSLVNLLASRLTNVPLRWTCFEGTRVHLARVFLSLVNICHYGTRGFLRLLETIGPLGTQVHLIQACGKSTCDL